MSKAKLLVALAAAAVLCLSLLGAANASALSISAESCTNVGGGTATNYSDGTCTTATGGGLFHRIPFTSKKVKSTLASSSIHFQTVNVGVIFEWNCTGLSGETTLTDAGEELTSSSAPLTFSGCTVVVTPNTAGCVVKAGGGAPGTIITNNLVSKTKRTGTSTYEQVYSPAVGGTFAVINISSCGMAALNGNREVLGVLAANITGEMKAEFTTTSGSSLNFGGQKLNLSYSSELDAAETGAPNPDRIFVGP